MYSGTIKVFNAILLLMLFVSMIFFFFYLADNIANAQTASQAIESINPSFGGKVTMYYLGGVQPPPLFGVCPPHTVVLTTNGTIIGVTSGKLYSHFNPASGYVLGRYFRFPVLTCPGAIGSALLPPTPPGTPVTPMVVAWPVYPLTFMGTSGY